MTTSASTSEIIEVKDELDLFRNFGKTHRLKIKLKETEGKYHNDVRSSPRIVIENSKKSVSDLMSESPNLKLALRKLCIAQASEMAAIKRASKLIGSSSVSDAGAIEKLYASLSAENQVCKACNARLYCKCSKNPNSKESENGSKGMQNRKTYVSKMKNIPRPVKSTVNHVLQKTESSNKKKGKNECGFDLNKAAIFNKYVMPIGTKNEKYTRSQDKGECSHSSKSSLGDFSCSTSISEESNYSGVSNNCSRPHMSIDVKWAAIRNIVKEQGSLNLNNFKLIKRLGCGDIGTVYLAELIGSGCLFALKVMDIEFLISRKKMLRAQTERDILQMLDHPFLPTLYTHFSTDNLSFLVMEYCPGGDLHVLRQMQPGRYFTEPAARFYVAEVLLALEYLHLLGVIYRDLKPENILVREDGHIMLSDFDLSMRCSVNPTLLPSSSKHAQPKPPPVPCTESDCIEPFCLEPSCFTPRLPKPKPNTPNSLPQLIVEPTSARSNSFVGTHEYLAPEIIRGDGHGSSVDWWTLGVFLYELIYGRTPFKGLGNEDTLSNAVSSMLEFPEGPDVGLHAKDLIQRLLVKDPEERLGSVRGAAEIKGHPFFAGLNWALIRCAAPPEVPGRDFMVMHGGDDIEFQQF